MQVEHTTGVFTLHNGKPAGFVGVLSCLLDGPDRGWTLGSVFASGLDFRAQTVDEWFEMTMDVEMVMRLSTMLIITSIQGDSRESRVACSSGVYVVSASGRIPRKFHLKLKLSSELSRVSVVDHESFEFRVNPCCARAIAEDMLKLVSVQWRCFEETATGEG